MSAQQQLFSDLAVPKVEYFGSGASAKWDFLAYRTARCGVGVTATELRASVIAMAAAFVNGEDCAATAGRVFLDSGAFGRYMGWRRYQDAQARIASGSARKGDEKVPAVLSPRLDFESEVFPVYEALIGAVNPGRHGGLLMVMPDVIGHHDESLALLRKHQATIRRWLAAGIEAIFPIPDGRIEVAEKAYRDIIDIAGTTRVVIGIPSNAEAWRREQVVSFAATCRPQRIHMLGLGEACELSLRSAKIAAVSPDTRISADSCQILAHVGEGRRLTEGARVWRRRIAEWCAEDTSRANPLVDLSAFVGAVVEDPGFVPPLAASRLAAAIGLDTEWQARFAAAAEGGLQEVVAAADPDEEWIYEKLRGAIYEQLYLPWAIDLLGGAARAWQLSEIAGEHPFG